MLIYSLIHLKSGGKQQPFEVIRGAVFVSEVYILHTIPAQPVIPRACRERPGRGEEPE
eukprot:COSAG02_NODE_60860_length_270_cov_0.602339_1_plen_57_part_10